MAASAYAAAWMLFPMIRSMAAVKRLVHVHGCSPFAPARWPSCWTRAIVLLGHPWSRWYLGADVRRPRKTLSGNAGRCPANKATSSSPQAECEAVARASSLRTPRGGVPELAVWLMPCGQFWSVGIGRSSNQRSTSMYRHPIARVPSPPSRTGGGNWPSLTRRHSVEREMPRAARTSLCLMILMSTPFLRSIC